ncbi:unnamed protein product [Sphagnum jensenii]|uniref:MobA/VirD2-like nuclease domain-containing protein n=1 Tax=Sphagnum jensenii TaxID=128206 RepID=A0ABP0VG10_9BRYO
MAVLIKGKSIKCTQISRDHYLRGPENERITVREVKGFATKDPDEALQMIAASAKGTKCRKPVYSTKINPETDRIWNKDEIRAAVDLLEENLGLKGHQRVIVEHKKHGRIHFHVLWSRFPPDGGAAVPMSNDYAIHQKTQRQLEKSFNLRPMMAKGRDFKQSEVEWAKRYGFDIFKLREQITTNFNMVKSGQEFMTSLRGQSMVLCKGDKCQFIIILPWGQHKALSSMIHGRPTKAILRRAMADIDITKLPTVQEGKAQVKATLPKAKSRTKDKSRHTSYKGARSSHTATWKRNSLSATTHQQFTDEIPKPNRKGDKTGKGDGAGGGAASAMSALKSNEKARETAVQKYPANAPTVNMGPERRRRNIWVPVERRERPKPK